MKCQHCGKNEATFYLKSNVNGEKQEVCLCQACAKSLGYVQRVKDAFRAPELTGRDFFGSSFFGDDLFGRMADPFAPLFGGLGARLLTEFPSPNEEEREEAPTASADLLTGEEQTALRRQREKNALEARLKAAIETENFEEAARLRDELKKLSA